MIEDKKAFKNSGLSKFYLQMGKSNYSSIFVPKNKDIDDTTQQEQQMRFALSLL